MAFDLLAIKSGFLCTVANWISDRSGFWMVEKWLQLVRILNRIWHPEAQPFEIRTNGCHFCQTIWTLTNGCNFCNHLKPDHLMKSDLQKVFTSLLCHFTESIWPFLDGSMYFMLKGSCFRRDLEYCSWLAVGEGVRKRMMQRFSISYDMNNTRYFEVTLFDK